MSFAAILAAAGCDRQPPAPDTRVLATVGSQRITESMFRDAMAHYGAGRSERFADPAARQALLDAMIQDAVLTERARAAGFDTDPQVLDAFRRAMVARLRAETLEHQLAAVTVDDTEVAAEYHAHIADYRTPAMRRAALIRIALVAGVSDEKRRALRAKAEALLDEAHALPADERGFGALAARSSDDRASRYRGGDIGWIPEDGSDSRWPQPLISALGALQAPGDTGPVIEADDGFYLVRLIERRPERIRPLDQVAANLRLKILRRKQRALEAEWLAGLREATPVQIDHAALDAVRPPTGPPVPVDERSPPRLPSG